MNIVINKCLDISITILLVYLFFPKEFSNSQYKQFICFFNTIFLLILLYFFPSDASLALIDFIITLLIIIFLLNNLWYQKIAAFFLIYSFTSFVYQSITLINNIIFNLPAFSGMNDDKEELFAKLISIIFLFIILFIKRKKHFYFYLSFANQIFLSLFSSIVVFLITFLKVNHHTIDNNLLDIIILICITTIFTIIFYLFSISQKNYYLEQTKIQSQYIHTLKTYYSALENNEKEIRKIKHDIKNHIRILNNLIHSKKYEESQKYIQQIDTFTTSKIPFIPNVGNVLINAILLQKSMEFSEITIEVKGCVQQNLCINDYDLCTIISNLLDNAIEYSINNHFSRIEFYIYQENSILLMKITNKINKSFNIKKLENHSFNPNKEHGYGIQNVREAINKNHGNFYYEQIEDKLFANIELFLPN